MVVSEPHMAEKFKYLNVKTRLLGMLFGDLLQNRSHRPDFYGWKNENFCGFGLRRWLLQAFTSSQLEVDKQ